MEKFNDHGQAAVSSGRAGDREECHRGVQPPAETCLGLEKHKRYEKKGAQYYHTHIDADASLKSCEKLLSLKHLHHVGWLRSLIAVLQLLQHWVNLTTMTTQDPVFGLKHVCPLTCVPMPMMFLSLAFNRESPFYMKRM